nr:retrovirus-related Pol polyprotein from transposon TNT 1-94 [Tanacetum cinerariifolium]GFA44504.1 retrovirus-related Pol polyprotein from transposon TNT 1-94 [Tanacetum cinerariifolium]GFA44512.1 retrovirus-related Pol polyprotein from transposon TNT 1-94 [Tanacetum cinerariifolium]
PIELVEDLGSGEKGEKEIGFVIPEVSTDAENLVYTRRSIEKRKDKRKAIMKEDKSIQNNSKNKLEQKRLGHEEAIRLQEHIFEEERQRIAKDAEIVKQLQEAIAEVDSTHDIYWNDHAVLRYHALQNRSSSIAEVRKNMCMYLKNQGGYKQSNFKEMSYKDIRIIFERVWDQIHAFVTMDSEIEKEVMQKSEFDLQQKQFAKEVSEKKDNNSSKLIGGSRKKTVAKKIIGAKLDEESAKRQKLKDVTEEEEATTEYEKEKEELRLSLKIIHNDDSEVNYEPLSKKFPIVSWENQLLENMEAKDMEEKVENGIVELYFVRTEYQLADIYNKPFPLDRFNFLIEKLGMRSMSPETLKHLAEEKDE